MGISSALVKELRESTGVGIMDCKQALVECDGDMQKAIEHLRTKGLAKAAKKSGRTASEGKIGSYIHNGDKIGVMVEINCETDFAARNEEFCGLVKDVAMHVAASAPLYVSSEDVPTDVVNKEKELLAAEARNSGKPEKVIEKMVEGRLRKYFEEICLLEQPFVKEPDKKIKDLVVEKIAKIGENISIRRFVRYQLGENM